MHQDALSYLADTPAARTLLATYRTECESRQADWLPRLFEVVGVEPTSLSSLHGKLIAFGCLEVDVTDLSIGVRYQVTSLGKQSLNQTPAVVAVSPEELTPQEPTAVDNTSTPLTVEQAEPVSTAA